MIRPSGFFLTLAALVVSSSGYQGDFVDYVNDDNTGADDYIGDGYPPPAPPLPQFVDFAGPPPTSGYEGHYVGVTVNLPEDVLEEFAGQPFCSLQPRHPGLPNCCIRRSDDCSRFVRKYNWTCYCDEFCQSPPNADCCPDYTTFCKGDLQNNCNYLGKTYQLNQEVKQNCNQCKCVKIGGKQQWECDNEVCVIRQELIDRINDQEIRGQLSWQATNYTFLFGKTLTEAVNTRLGTLLPNRYRSNYKTITHNIQGFVSPDHFDWRNEARVLGGLHEVKDQHDCNVSYAYSTTAVLSDRLAIHKREMLRKRVSPQFLISCLAAYNRTDPNKLCHARDIYAATGFLRQFESVSEGCFPTFLPSHDYDAAQYSERHGIEKWCKEFIRQSFRAQRLWPKYRGDTECPAVASVTRERKSASTPWVLVRPEQVQIMFEILRNGPVLAVFTVREDFFLYRSGVYSYSALNEDKPSRYRRAALHSVRVVGWGEDILPSGRRLKYWICDNSWGTQWGEGGFFRIERDACAPTPQRDDYGAVEDFISPPRSLELDQDDDAATFDTCFERNIIATAAGTLHQHRRYNGDRRHRNLLLRQHHIRQKHFRSGRTS